MFTLVIQIKVSQVSIKLVLGSGSKCLHRFVVNLLAKQLTKFYPNRRNFVEDMMRNILVCFFMNHSVYIYIQGVKKKYNRPKNLKFLKTLWHFSTKLSGIMDRPYLYKIAKFYPNPSNYTRVIQL